MSAGLIRDLVVAQTRGLKLPGIARTFEGLAGKRAMLTARMKTSHRGRERVASLAA